MSLSVLPQGVNSINDGLFLNYRAFSCRMSDDLITRVGENTHFDDLVDLYKKRTEFASSDQQIGMYNGKPVLLNEIKGDFNGAAELVIGSNIAHMVEPSVPLTYPIYVNGKALLATDYVVTSIDVSDNLFYKNGLDAAEGFVTGSLLAYVFNSKSPKYILDLVTNKYIPLGLTVDLKSIREDLKLMEYGVLPSRFLSDLSHLEILRNVALRISLISDLIPDEMFDGAFYVINKLGRNYLTKSIKSRMKTLPNMVDEYIKLYKL